MKKNQIALKDLERKRVIGVGGQGVVYLMKHIKTGQQFALKFFKSDDFQQVAGEFRTVREISSPYIVQYLRLFDLRHNQLMGNNVAILMDYVPGMDLHDTVAQVTLTEKERYRLFLEVAVQLLRALQVLWSHHIVHYDLKPDNIMIDVSSQGVKVVLVDFGISCARKPADQMRACYFPDASGTSVFFSPERAAVNLGVKAKFSYEKDEMWTLGYILSFILSKGKNILPCSGRECYELLYNSDPRKHITQFQLQDRDKDAKAFNFIKKLLSRNEIDRPSRASALEWAEKLYADEFDGSKFIH